MSGRLPRVTATEILRALRRDGWQVLRQSGSHITLTHPTKPGLTIVPAHRGTLKVGTMASIIKQAGLTADELRRLL